MELPSDNLIVRIHPLNSALMETEGSLSVSKLPAIELYLEQVSSKPY